MRLSKFLFNSSLLLGLLLVSGGLLAADNSGDLGGAASNSNYMTVVFDYILNAVLDKLAVLPMISSPWKLWPVQTIIAGCFIWEIRDLIKEYADGALKWERIFTLICYILLVLSLYGVIPYRTLIPARELWNMADSAGGSKKGADTLERDLYNIIKYQSNEASKPFISATMNPLTGIRIAQYVNLIGELCDGKQGEARATCYAEKREKYVPKDGVITEKAVNDLAAEYLSENSSYVPASEQFWKNLMVGTFGAVLKMSFIIQVAMGFVILVMNLIALCLINLLLLVSVLEATVLLIFLKILYPFFFMTKTRTKMWSLMKHWFSFAILGFLVSIACFCSDTMIQAIFSLFTSESGSLPGPLAVVVGLLFVPPASIGIIFLIKVILVSLLLVKIVFLMQITKLAKGIFDLQFDALANMGASIVQTGMGLVQTGAMVMTGGAAAMAAGGSVMGGMKNTVKGLFSGKPGGGSGGSPVNNFSPTPPPSDYPAGMGPISSVMEGGSSQMKANPNQTIQSLGSIDSAVQTYSGLSNALNKPVTHSGEIKQNGSKPLSYLNTETKGYSDISNIKPVVSLNPASDTILGDKKLNPPGSNIDVPTGKASHVPSGVVEDPIHTGQSSTQRSPSSESSKSKTVADKNNLDGSTASAKIMGDIIAKAIAEAMKPLMQQFTDKKTNTDKNDSKKQNESESLIGRIKFQDGDQIKALQAKKAAAEEKKSAKKAAAEEKIAAKAAADKKEADEADALDQALKGNPRRKEAEEHAKAIAKQREEEEALKAPGIMGEVARAKKAFADKFAAEHQENQKVTSAIEGAGATALFSGDSSLGTMSKKAQDIKTHDLKMAEFFKGMDEKASQKERLSMYDINNDGKITVEEMTDVIEGLLKSNKNIDILKSDPNLVRQQMMDVRTQFSEASKKAINNTQETKKKMSGDV